MYGGVGNVFITDQTNSTCRALYAVPVDNTTYYLKWTSYASSDILGHCDYSFEDVTTSDDGVVSQRIYEAGSPLIYNLNGTNYNVNELFSYSGAMLTMGTRYKISINAYARTWQSCSDQIITVCSLQNISCDPTSSNLTNKLTNCENRTFVMPNGETLDTKWNCTESNEGCFTYTCNEVSINQLAPNGTCHNKVYFHVVGVISSISGEFYSKFDTWRTLEDSSSNVIDYPIEPYDLSAGFSFFPESTGAKKRAPCPSAVSSFFSSQLNSFCCYGLSGFTNLCSNQYSLYGCPSLQ